MLGRWIPFLKSVEALAYASYCFIGDLEEIRMSWHYLTIDKVS